MIFGFDENELKVQLIKSDLKQYAGKWSLLGDLVHRDEDLDQAAYRILKDRTGMDDVYLEQVRSFGDVKRHPPPVWSPSPIVHSLIYSNTACKKTTTIALA
ncbi:MAG: NUDIX hydrolase [Puia sp.]